MTRGLNYQHPKRILLASRDLGQCDFTRHFSEIAEIADANRCTMIGYGLHTFDTAGGRHSPTPKLLFGNSKHVRYVLLETADLETETNPQSELWIRGQAQPKIWKIQFARGSEATPEKRQALVNGFDDRIFGRSAVLICGEIALLRYRRKEQKMLDEGGILRRLDRAGISIAWANAHTYMRRPETKWKRQALSRNRVLLSVWNTQREIGREPKNAWHYLVDGEDRSAEVQLIPHSIPRREDIRLGLIDLTKV